MIIIIGKFIKLLLTLNDCYKFILVIVIMVMKVKRKHSKLSGEYYYIIFLISLHWLYFIVTVMNNYDNVTIDESKSNDEVSDEYVM